MTSPAPASGCRTESEAPDEAAIAMRVQAVTDVIAGGMSPETAITVAIITAYYDGKRDGILSTRDEWLKAVRS